MRPNKMMLLSLPFFATLLTGCATKEAVEPLDLRTQLVSPDVPAALRHCEDAPAVPGKGGTQRAVSSYIVRLHDAHADCFSKLNRVDKILSESEAQVTAFNKTQESPR